MFDHTSYFDVWELCLVLAFFFKFTIISNKKLKKNNNNMEIVNC